MVRKVLKSTRDTENLERIGTLAPKVNLEQPENYRDRVVLKPWGHEFLMFENPFVAIWFLHIKADFATSMHCHPSKRTSLIVLKGRAFCNTLNHRIFMDSLDAAVFEKGVFHSTKALSEDGIDLIEIETPPLKTDLVRLNDAYGRQSFGYEGLAEMRKSDLERFGYFYMQDPVSASPVIHTEKAYQVRVDHFSSSEDFNLRFHLHPDHIYCSCRGNLRTVAGELVLELGEAKMGSELLVHTQFCLDPDLTLITTSLRAS